MDMFNYAADHVIVLHPRSAGGAVLSFLLSLDARTHDLRFQQATLEQKLHAWQSWQQQTSAKEIGSIHANAHAYGCINFNREPHHAAIDQADWGERYVHKCHFFELLSENGPVPLLEKLTGSVSSVGVYVTPGCVERIQQLRPYTEPIDWYQMWIYANQRSIMPNYFGIKSLHHFSFSEMLDRDLFLDHVRYCGDVLSLSLDLDVCSHVIEDWHRGVLGLTT